MYDTNILIKNGVNLEKSLELFNDIATYNDNLDEFLEDVSGRLKELDEYLRHEDMSNYAIIVHSIKSDAKYFGFEKLAELALNHEMKSKENDVNYVNENYNELLSEINRVINAVKEYMGLDEVKEEKKETEEETLKDTILVVDDSNVISNFIAKLFNDTFNVITAKDGQEAIDKLSSLQYKLKGMLLDLNMPNVNGYEVLKFMKTNDIFKRVNVAIITGTNSDEVLGATRDYPIKAILEKPFNETNVKKVVEMISNR